MNQDKLVLFDLGGVVIDIDFARVWQFWTKAAGVPLGKLAQELGPASSNNDAFHCFERGELSEEQFYAATSERTGMRMHPQEWHEGWNAIFVGDMPGTFALLQQLTGKTRLMALSNINAPHHAVTSTRFAHLLAPFEKVFFSHELGLRKPEHKIFNAVSDYSGIAAHNILFFDDMISNVEGARQAGLQAEVFVDAAQARIRIATFLDISL
jgi:glucose-1-phosphatase